MGALKLTRTAPSEHDIQSHFVDWLRIMTAAKPGLGLMFAIPNGGARNIITATKLRAEGVLAGVPDMFLPVAAAGHHGLFIEFKTQAGRLSIEQSRLFPLLIDRGYQVSICRSVAEAIETVCQYIGWRKGENGHAEVN